MKRFWRPAQAILDALVTRKVTNKILSTITGYEYADAKMVMIHLADLWVVTVTPQILER